MFWIMNPFCFFPYTILEFTGILIEKQNLVQCNNIININRILYKKKVTKLDGKLNKR